MAFHLTSRKQTTALTAGSIHSVSSANPLAAAPSSPPRQTYAGSTSTKNLLEFTPRANGLGASADDNDFSQQSAKNKHDFNSITEALVLVEALRQELERVQVGLTLLCFSVDKLMDIVSVEPACCPSLFDFFVPRTQQSIGRDSVGLYVASPRRSAPVPNGTGVAGGVGNRIASVGARASNAFKNHRIRQAGYKDISAANSNVFSIEGNDDEEDM